MSWDIDFYMKSGDGNEYRLDVGYDLNYTHNTNNMLREVGFLVNSWGDWDGVQVGVFRQAVADAVNLLKENPHLSNMNPENGWGSYDGLIDIMSKTLEASNRVPADAIVRVCY